jgi:hypothetical protein
MSSNQMLITIGGMVLLLTVILRVNTNYLESDKVLLNSKFCVLATSLASSIIEEACGKAFDAATDTASVDDLALLTHPYSLGHGYQEAYEDFNDFDDFHKFTKIDTTLPSAVFKITSQVGYIDPANPDEFITSRSWHKKINVKVTSESMTDTVKMSSIYSYWYFR